MKKFLAKFAKDESGATAIEYGLIAAGISIVIIASLPAITAALGGIWAQVAAALGG